MPPKSCRPPPSALALLGTLPVLLATARYGIGLSPDSIGYLSAAKSISAGAGVLNWDGTALVVQPPLYPVLLAIAHALPGLPPLHAAAWLNALLFGTAIFLAGRIARRFLGFSPLWTGMFLATLAAARPLFMTAIVAWSEMLFIVLLLAFLAAAMAWRETGSRKHLLLFALSASAAIMTRYIGVTLFATGALAILLFHRRRPLSARAFDTAVFAAVAATPFILWLLRNMALSGTWMGPRSGSGFSLGQNLLFTAVTVLCWYLPLKELHVFALFKKLYLGATTGGASAASPLFVPTRGTEMRLFSPASWIPALFVFLYTALLVYSSTTTGYDQISDRLLAPVYIPATLLLFAGLRRVRNAAVPALVLLLCVAVPGIHLGRTVTVFLRDGVGAGDDSFGQYNSRAWRESGTMRFLREHVAPGEPVYSNSAWAVYQWTGLRAWPLSGTLRPVNEWMTGDSALVAWFRHEFRESRDPEGIFEGVGWSLVAELHDGAVYRVRRQ